MIAGSYEVGGPRGHGLLMMKWYANDALITFIWLLCCLLWCMLWHGWGRVPGNSTAQIRLYDDRPSTSATLLLCRVDIVPCSIRGVEDLPTVYPRNPESWEGCAMARSPRCVMMTGGFLLGKLGRCGQHFRLRVLARTGHDLTFQGSPAEDRIGCGS